MSEPKVNPYESPREECVEDKPLTNDELRELIEKFREQTSELSGSWLFIGFLTVVLFILFAQPAEGIGKKYYYNEYMFIKLAISSFITVLFVVMAISIALRGINAVRVGLLILYLLLLGVCNLSFNFGWPFVMLSLPLIPAILQSHRVLKYVGIIQAAGYRTDVKTEDIE